MVEIKVQGLSLVRARLAYIVALCAARSATTAASVAAPRPTPPIGTPGAFAHGGNSTPARPLVAGFGKSPGFGPVSGE